jgi:pimeloyl-ACP methyl ester carboxylesterase
MPLVDLDDITLHYTTHGTGMPLLLIHGGWGLAVNGFEFQTRTLADEFQLIVPDRRGYGQSTHVVGFDADFHWQHAYDMVRFLDALKIDRVLVWGHSDGAIIAAIMALLAPDRIGGFIFEGGHLYCRKPDSDYPMDKIGLDPTLIPEAAQSRLADYHGADYWLQVIRNWAGGWVALHDRVGEDLYRGRLSEITCPALIIHGAHDEHTFPHEIEELARRIPHARLVIYPDGGHSIHDSRALREACTQMAREFLRECNLASAAQ